MKRLSSLDYLRGLAAFGIMIFHYSMWAYGLFSAQDFLGRAGIYAVSIFYVLSGLTLYHVYQEKIGSPSMNGLKDYAIKRVFRIFPLLWLVTIVTLLYSKEHFSIQTIFLNFSGLFSVIHWDNTIAYGAWSIGNELAFYFFFPLFIFLLKRSRIALSVFLILSLLIYLWFAFIHMDSSKTLAVFWADYTNPLNQVFLFLGGCLLGTIATHISVPKPLSLMLIIACMLVFIFLPVSGDSVRLVTGINRLIFTMICFTLCFSFYKTDFGLPFIAGRAFQLLGEISYSVYLVHPAVWALLTIFYNKGNLHLNPALRLSIGITLSLVVAYTIFQLYEKLFMRLGKKVSLML
jgi:exopolysaccharide production protein ExoZ